MKFSPIIFNLFVLFALYLPYVSTSAVSARTTKQTKYEKTLYVLSVGVDINHSESFQKLDYAIKDATKFAKRISERKPNATYQSIYPVTLLGDEATKSNIRDVLRVLAGKPQVCQGCRIEQKLKKLSQKIFAENKTNRLRPEDGLLIFFSGHGYRKCQQKAGGECQNENFGNELHLIVYDTERNESGNIGGETDLSFKYSWTDAELEEDLAEIQVGRMAIILDSCFSGASEATSDDWRLGPLNSSGFSQLIYEKGIFILASSQKNQQSREKKELGNGSFTFALLKALENRPPEGINLSTWFENSKNEMLGITTKQKKSPAAEDASTDTMQAGDAELNICKKAKGSVSEGAGPMNPAENVRTTDISKPDDLEQSIQNQVGLDTDYKDYLSRNTGVQDSQLRLALFFSTFYFSENPKSLCEQKALGEKVKQKEADLKICETIFCQNRVILNGLFPDKISESAFLNPIQEPKFLFYQRQNVNPADWIF